MRKISPLNLQYYPIVCLSEISKVHMHVHDMYVKDKCKRKSLYK